MWRPKIARDITERKQREEEIRFQSHLLDAVERAVSATDPRNSCLLEFICGISLWLVGGRGYWLKYFGTHSRRRGPRPCFGTASLFKEGKSWSGEFLVRRKDGSVFPAMVTDSPIFNKEGKLVGVVGVSVDISERRRAEEERAKLHESERTARAEAEKANHLKDEFLATLSHELRNPLNVILGYAEVLLRSEEAQSSQFVKRAAEILKRNALAQSRLVRDLLDLSRLHVGKLSLNMEAVSCLLS